MGIKLADRIKVIGTSKIEESLRILEQHPEIVSLGAGEPDFPAPPNVIKSAEKFLERGYTHYSPLQGRHELREELVKKLKKDNKIDVTPEEIIITCGSKEAILLSVMTLVNPKEEVIIPDPGYIAYRPIVEMFNSVAKSLPLNEDDQFEVHPEILEKLITNKTKLLILNTPSNPTGGVLTRKVLEEIADIVVDKNLMVLCDEAYEKLIYDNAKHVSMASLNGMKDYVVTTQTFSKTYAMCGFRVGYAVANEKIIKEMKEFKICTTLAAPTFAQLAAVEALKNSADYVKKMVREYDRRRKMLIKRLNEIPNISCTKPKGAFYAFPNIKRIKMSSEKFSDFLLKKAKVVVIPGIEFGKYGEGYIRLSYATAYEKIAEALDRIEKVVSKL
ncbi:MAG: pyridoxal phosphate-dependent aminotransferase [Candidatus Aenigmatarchaeota archaeon]|nr:pyridoxal phosphate-dependent aminotransferase [Candidatus Aenigmarchaeota archaeon]